MKHRYLFLTVSVFYVLFTAVFFAGKVYVDSHGMEYRTWVSVWGYFIFWVLSFGLGAFGIAAAGNYLKRKKRRNRWPAGVLLLLIVYLICVSLLSIFAGFMALFSVRTESRKETANGTVIEVTIPRFLDKSEHYFCEPVGIFARKPIVSDLDPEFLYETDEIQESNKTQEEQSREEQTQKEQPKAEERDKSAKEDEVQKEWQDQNLKDPYSKAARLIYDQILKEKGCSFVQGFDAKGNTYYDLGSCQETIGEEQKELSERLVFDRMSKNGKCYLYAVNGTEYDGQNTYLVEYYAVDLKTKTVIPSGKRNYAQTGSREYQEATGEY